MRAKVCASLDLFLDGPRCGETAGETMSGDSEYNRRVHQRMQEELAEYNTSGARYQQRLDQW